MTGLLIMTAFAILMGWLASRYGVDTRDGQDWREGVGQRRPKSVRGAA